ncbi:MAG: hypothetical protein HY868_24245 [Chloroflexi bacterium]|nr:hypothetical protein [Chloroflexota bacterium]
MKILLCCAWLALFLVACAPTIAPDSATSAPGTTSAPAPVLPTVAPLTTPRYKMFVTTDGLYRVTASALRDAGANLDTLDPATLQVFSGDREIPIRVLGDKTNFTLDWYGVASRSPYSAFNVYWLTWGAHAGKRMRESVAPASSVAPKDAFTDALRVTKPNLYAIQAGALNDRWFWQTLVAPLTTTVAITLPNALAVSARAQVNLWGTTQDGATPDHHIALFWNNTRVADDKWDGQGAHTITATIPANAVKPGENTLRLTAPGDTRAQADIVLLRGVDVTYTRRLTAQADALAFEPGAGAFRVDGFSGDVVELLDITDPNDPVRVTNPTLAARALTFGATAARRYLAVGPNGRQTPARLAPMSNVNLRAPQQRADYVIITHASRDFVAALQPLVKYRAERGLATMLVTVGDVYDNFAGGNETPYAIRDFLRLTQSDWARPAPRFALLVGKASYDYRDYSNGANKNLVPTFVLDTPNLNEAASDNWFVVGDEKTGAPALALGRIPAKTSEQVTRVVDKIIAYENSKPADWQRRALYVTDDKELSFADIANELAETIPSNFQAQKVHLAERKGDLAAARRDIIAQWNQGAWMLSYIGHGSVDTWAAGPLFSSENLKEIKNGERLPLLITPTCLDGYFYHPQKDSLTEDALFKNDGGIIAGIVPTGLSFPDAQHELMEKLYAELFKHNTATWGEALMRAKQKMRGDLPEMREVIDTFVFLGDPALRVILNK